ncbi:SAM-dependent methyltransferase [Paenibacillus darwinianus]|uniref:SAM-dependent methyltransferase n=1 Tax=Paenibacillus darwinianus TaxID=1380763 RepID=A0A9W5S3H2_9BACL|nr:class I SAM-dependent methyltransferase [Paenibacillus darwinianus]EXX91873.1 SAM-dependent methyltransferase [Paenibacillus darwinianus]EXX92352.1 SAM-dependent methyltransferase [Paenibacillus darwinianus]EXX92716.1 SAM-dependent methyltransferase [Paenibacillus darwinianus]
MLKLSKRLLAIADLVPPGARVADIGSDHAQLPVYLVQSGKAVSAIAGELNEGPLRAARSQIAAAGLTGRIQARQADGLAAIEAGEADCVTVAGMGGALMSAILTQGEADGKLQGVTTLVLQPNVGEDAVREWLLANGWYLAAERILEEDGKIYEVLQAINVADAGPLNRALYDAVFLPLDRAPEEKREWLIRMGPWLLRQPDAVVVRKWESEQDKLRAICRSLGLSEQPEAQEKSAVLLGHIDTIGEVLACLHMVKPSLN